MYHPTRGGTRGGQAEFSWDQVRNDKDREHYLGHAIMAPTGRWQNGRDVNWYNKDKADAESDKEKAARLEELRQIKLAEEQALASVLGYVPASSSGPTVGTALLAGSSARVGPGTASSTGANTQPIDAARSRWAAGGAAGPSAAAAAPGRSSRGGQGSDDDDESDDGSGLTREERRAARKVAKLEVRKQLLSEKEQRKAEREERRARKREREERRAQHGGSHDRDRDRDEPRYGNRDRDGGRDSPRRDHDRRYGSSRHDDDDRERDRDRRRRSRSPLPDSKHRDGDRNRPPKRRSRSRSPDRRDRLPSRDDHRDAPERVREGRREDDYYGRISTSSRSRRSPTPPFRRS